MESASFGGEYLGAASAAGFGSSTTYGHGREEVWMLTLYAKNEADSIPGHILKKIKEEIDGAA